MKCPKCGKKAEKVSKMFDRQKGKWIQTHKIYEHRSRIENGFRVVSSSDCCYVRLTKREPDLKRAARKSKRLYKPAVSSG